MQNNIYFILFLFASFFLPQHLCAETIKLNSGETIDGKILKQDKGSILVDVGIETPVTYFKDEIKEIVAAAPETASDITAENQKSSQADHLEAKAVDLIDTNQTEQGIVLMKQAIALDPAASRHMNYGSILFGNGVSLFKKGMIDDAKKIFLESQDELNKAIDGFQKDKDQALIGQAYFLLGQMQEKAFGDLQKAKEFYNKAVAISDNASAKAALRTE